MAVTTLVVTPGAANANSYVALSVANQYHEDRPAADSAWSGATTDQRNAALLWATKLLDRYFFWHGSVVTQTQKLLWPRYGLVDVNDWNPLDYTTIPELIQFATAEFARQLLADDRTADSDIEKLGISLLKVGPLRLDFDGSGYTQAVPDVVSMLIPENWGYLRSSAERELMRA